MREEVFQAESVLERLLAESPAMLAGDDDSSTRRLLLLGRTDDQAGPDYVFLDQEGIPTLVEVTRSGDPDASRELVGQMVDFVANVIAYQDPAALRAMLEARCRVEGRDVQDVLHEDLGVDMEPRHFWEHVRVNMSVGRMRLIFAADAIPAPLQRIVEFLNEQMSPTEVLALEIRQYVDEAGRQHTLVTRVFGWTAAAQRRKGRGPARAAWTWEDFRRALPKPQFDVAQALARELDAAIVQRGLDWKPEFRRSAIAYQRPGGYTVVADRARGRDARAAGDQAAGRAARAGPRRSLSGPARRLEPDDAPVELAGRVGGRGSRGRSGDRDRAAAPALRRDP